MITRPICHVLYSLLCNVRDNLVHIMISCNCLPPLLPCARFRFFVVRYGHPTIIPYNLVIVTMNMIILQEGELLHAKQEISSETIWVAERTKRGANFLNLTYMYNSESRSFCTDRTAAKRQLTALLPQTSLP